MHGAKQRQRLLDVIGIEQRQRGLMLREPLAVGVLGVVFLIMRGIQQQQAGQRLGGRRAVHRAVEAVVHQPRQVADMVDVRVRQHDGVNLRRIERQSLPIALP